MGRRSGYLVGRAVRAPQSLLLSLVSYTVERNQRWYKLKDIPRYWIGRINTVKMTLLSKAMYRFITIYIKSPMAFFTELEQFFFLILWKHGRPQIAKAILRKENGAGRIRLPDFRLYHKATFIKRVCYWYKKKRHIDQ